MFHMAFSTDLERFVDIKVLIKLLIENNLIIFALGNLHYKISREKFEPEPGFEPRTSGAPPGKSGIRLKREI